MEYECSVVDLDVTCVIFVYTADVEDFVAVFLEEIGRASCRERV